MNGIGNGSMSGPASMNPNQRGASAGGGMGSPMNNSSPFGSTSPQSKSPGLGQNTRTNGLGNGSMPGPASMKPNQRGASAGGGMGSPMNNSSPFGSTSPQSKSPGLGQNTPGMNGSMSGPASMKPNQRGASA